MSFSEIPNYPMPCCVIMPRILYYHSLLPSDGHSIPPPSNTMWPLLGVLVRTTFITFVILQCHQLMTIIGVRKGQTQLTGQCFEGLQVVGIIVSRDGCLLLRLLVLGPEL